MHPPVFAVHLARAHGTKNERKPRISARFRPSGGEKLHQCPGCEGEEEQSAGEEAGEFAGDGGGGDDPGEAIRQDGHGGNAELALDGAAGVARAFRDKADGAEGAAKGGAVDEQPDGGGDDEEGPGLHGHTEEEAIAQREEALGEAGEGSRAASERFGESAEEREGAEGDDEGRQTEARDEGRNDATAQLADRDGTEPGDPRREAGIVPEHAKGDRAQAEQRADGEIDAAGEDDGRHDQREQSDLDGLADDIRDIVRGEEAAAEGIEEGDLRDEDEQEDDLLPGENSEGEMMRGENVAEAPKYSGLWTGKTPEHFTEGLTEVRELVKATVSRGAEQSAPITGNTEALRNLRTDLEKRLYAVARGRVRKFVFWTGFGVAVGAPSGARARRKALTEQLPNDGRAIEAKFSELDDLMIQFADTAAGDEFVGAWFNARKVVELGRRAAKPAVAVPEPGPAPR